MLGHVTTVLVIVGVVLAGSALFAAAWVLSGPRFQNRSRGRRPEYSSDAEQEALLRAPGNSVNQSGAGSFP
jgi:hypothetical protein